jgi:predicted dehydrogenase
MLRYILGDSLFFKSLKDYAGDVKFKYGNVSTSDFIQSINQDRKPSVDAEQGLMVQKVLEAVQQSIAEKRFVSVSL